MFRDAVNRRRVLLFVIDESNHSTFNGTISPQEVNDMGLLLKQIWPGALTFVRMGARSRAGGTTMRRRRAAIRGLTTVGFSTLVNTPIRPLPAQKYASEKNLLAALNMGMVPGLNWWAGGIGHRGETSLDGVAACWDIENNGSSSGYIVGISQTALPPGTHVNCGQRPNAVTRTVASPAWTRRWADMLASDADAPFALMWRTADDTQTIPGAEALAARFGLRQRPRLYDHHDGEPNDMERV